MDTNQIINHFKNLQPRERAYLTVRALEIAGFKVDAQLNLAILSGRI